MTKWLVLLLVPGGSIVMAYLALRWLSRQIVRDTLVITPPRQIFIGHDEALERQTRRRREHAAAIKADSLRLETKDDRRSQLHVVSR